MIRNVLFLILLITGVLQAQVGIDTETPQATLDVMASPGKVTLPDGFIAPRMTGQELLDKDNLYNLPQKGAIIYAESAVPTTTARTVNVTSEGYYYFDGSVWVRFATGNANPPVTADNGLTKTANNIQLGGTLLKNTNIAMEGFDATYSGEGNIGIGLTAPTRKLDVNGIAKIRRQLMVNTGDDTDATLGVRNVDANMNIVKFVREDGIIISSMNNDGDFGVGTNIPTERLDIANGNVRVRTINSYTGNVETDRLVVADNNGVLKTINKQNPVIRGNNLSDAVATARSISSTDGSANASGITNYPFVISEKSLVTFDYTLSYTVGSTLANWGDGRLRGVQADLIFIDKPAASSIPLNSQFAASSNTISFDNNGRPGYYFLTGSQTLLLEPGNYTLQLVGRVIGTPTTPQTTVTAEFGGSGADRMTITAVQVL